MDVERWEERFGKVNDWFAQKMGKHESKGL